MFEAHEEVGDVSGHGEGIAELVNLVEIFCPTVTIIRFASSLHLQLARLRMTCSAELCTNAQWLARRAHLRLR